MPNKPTKSAGPIKNTQINKPFTRESTYSLIKNYYLYTRMLNGKETKQSYGFKNNAHTLNADTKDQSAPVQNIQVPSDQDPNEPIVTYSTFVMHIVKDPIINYDQTLERSKDDGAHKKKNKKASDQDIDNLVAYNSYTKYDRMRWYEDPKMSYRYKEFKKPIEAHNKHDGGASKKDGRSYCKDSKAMTNNESEKKDCSAERCLILDPDTLSRAVSWPRSIPDREYEEEMKIKSEFTYRALLSQIQMQQERQSRDPYNLYKLLNRQFIRANTEDFFKNLISDIVEVLEHFSVWIAEKLSLPLPDPVDHDKLIYMRQEELNYTYFLTEKIKRLISRGNVSNESVGFMYLDQW